MSSLRGGSANSLAPYPVKPPGIELTEKPARITLDFSNVSSAFCLRQETYRCRTKVPPHRKIELAAKEIAGVKGNRI